MGNTALIFGAGKTGRGFAAHLAFLGGYEIVLVDKNKDLVNALKKEGQYTIQVLGHEEANCTIPVTAAYDLDDLMWHQALIETDLAFTAVFGNNLEELAESLAPALRKRSVENPEKALTIITCENKTNAAGFLKSCVLKALGNDVEPWLSKHVGFSEGIIFRTCLDAAAGQSTLTIRAQNFFDLPCDGNAIREELHVPGLTPLKNFSHQLERKIFTYNCINAVITYLGAQKGYDQLADAAVDEEILTVAEKAAKESSQALIAEYHFDPQEQQEWTNAAFGKFSDRNVPDPITRNGADPVRKLGRNDRLIGPALLALKHKIHPEGLMKGVVAAMSYRDPVTKVSVRDMITEKGAAVVLKEICGLREGEELFTLIKEQLVKGSIDEK